MSASHRITPDDLDVVNRTVWAVRRKLDELAHMYGTPVTDFLSVSPDPTGLFWMGEVSDLVISHLSDRMPDLVDSWAKSDKSGYMSLWFASYRKAATWTLFGVLHRERALFEARGTSVSSESYASSEMALRYELSVLDTFSRWSDMSRLGRMDEWSYKSEPPAIGEMSDIPEKY